EIGQEEVGFRVVVFKQQHLGVIEELAALALRIAGFDQEAEEVFTRVTVFEVGKLIPPPAQRGFGRLDGVGPFADVKQLVRQRQCQMWMMANSALTHAQKAVAVAREREEMEQNARLVRG